MRDPKAAWEFLERSELVVSAEAIQAAIGGLAVEIERRLDRARQEMAAYREYEYTVVNDDLEAAGRRIQAVATAVRLETARNQARVEKILASFGGTT